MQYENILGGTFVERPNRFIAHVLVAGQQQVCHVKNTGRCRELLVPGCQVYLQHFPSSPHRRTAYDLIAVQKGPRLINMDSQAPNKIFAEWVKKEGNCPGLQSVRSEYTLGDSRYDFLLETDGGQILVEVKGVTLEQDGVVLFPDAPTLRGVKHLEGLSRWAQAGGQSWVVFIVQMEGVQYLTPNSATQPAFAEALSQAAQSGVRLLALDCQVTASCIEACHPVAICL